MRRVRWASGTRVSGRGFYSQEYAPLREFHFPQIRAQKFKVVQIVEESELRQVFLKEGPEVSLGGFIALHSARPISKVALRYCLLATPSIANDFQTTKST